MAVVLSLNYIHQVSAYLTKPRLFKENIIFILTFSLTFSKPEPFFSWPVYKSNVKYQRTASATV